MQSPRNNPWRVVVAGVLLACALVFTRPTPASAVDGLAVSSSTTYGLDPDAAVVHARTELGFTNTTTDVEEDGVVKRQFFSAFTFPVPVGAVAAQAVDGAGTPLAVTSNSIEDNTSFFTFTVTFAAPLYSGEHVDVVFTYDISGLPPRSPDPSRVNPAYVAFTAYGVGDPGQASIRVEVPDAYDIDTLGSDAEVTTTPDGLTVYTADAIAQPDQFALFVSARADAALTRTPLAVEGARFDVRSWPGDDEWQQFITTQVAAGVPQLAGLVGQPWPVTDVITVREALTPYLYGYAGWFSAADDELEIGEDLDVEVVLHELSHAWFNTSWFDDRWVNEGLAQTVAAAAVAEAGGTPTPAVAPAPDDPARISLIQWGQPDFVRGSDDTETYGYAASNSVIQQIVDRIGLDGMRRVLAAVQARTIAYVSSVPAEPDTTATTDWRRLLDLVDELGPDTAGTGWSAQPLFAAFVITPELGAELDQRAEARAAFARLVEVGNGWLPPLAVRRAMADWNFGEANTAMAASTELLDLREQLIGAAAPLGVDLRRVTDTMRTEYEAATDLAGMRDQLVDLIDTVAVVQHASDRSEESVGAIDRVGLIGADPPGDVAAALLALDNGRADLARTSAQHALDSYDEAAGRGVQRAGIVGAALVLMLMLGAAAVRRARRDQAADA